MYNWCIMGEEHCSMYIFATPLIVAVHSLYIILKLTISVFSYHTIPLQFNYYSLYSNFCYTQNSSIAIFAT